MLLLLRNQGADIYGRAGGVWHHANTASAAYLHAPSGWISLCRASTTVTDVKVRSGGAWHPMLI